MPLDRPVAPPVRGRVAGGLESHGAGSQSSLSLRLRTRRARRSAIVSGCGRSSIFESAAVGEGATSGDSNSPTILLSCSRALGTGDCRGVLSAERFSSVRNLLVDLLARAVSSVGLRLSSGKKYIDRVLRSRSTCLGCTSNPSTLAGIEGVTD